MQEPVTGTSPLRRGKLQHTIGSGRERILDHVDGVSACRRGRCRTRRTDAAATNEQTCVAPGITPNFLKFPDSMCSFIVYRLRFSNIFDASGPGVM
jgi:hypothetical protein